MPFVFNLIQKQGQGNQCQTPGGKFEELTWWKKGGKVKKMEETGRNGETEEKNKTKGQHNDLPFFTLLIFKPIWSHFFVVKTCVFMKTFFLGKLFFSENMVLGEIMFFFENMSVLEKTYVLVKHTFFEENIILVKTWFLVKT